MGASAAISGRCLCGDVALQGMAPPEYDVCHCGMCRTWGGGPAMMVHAEGPVTFTGGTVQRYDSSDWAERGFCATCGTHLFYRLKAQDMYFVPVGLLEQQHGMGFTAQLFIDHKPASYAFANATAQLTEAEVIAQFASLPDTQA